MQTSAKRLITAWKIIRRLLLRSRPLFWRGFVCWSLGCVLLLSDEVKSFDFRFQMRGDQAVAQNVVIVKIHPDEVMTNYRLRGRLSTWKDIVDVTDSFYWDPVVWGGLIERILAQKPRSVGVTVYLTETLRNPNLSDRLQKLFSDPRLTWAAATPGGDRAATALFADATQSNVGIYELTRDEDGVIRRFNSGSSGLPHLVEKVTGTSMPYDFSGLINYRGGTNVFPEYSLSEIIEGSVPEDAFKDKIVLIGAETNSNSQFLTPLGPSHRAGVMAQIVDNIEMDRWVKRAPMPIYMLGLLGLLLLTIVILVQYPGSVALLFLMWVVTLLAALSIWTFDTFSFWLPIFSATVQVFATWIIFLGYQANKIERKNFELRQERRYLEELEQLKSNFISLISHDLKTPIAKIQAVVDRLITEQREPSLRQDLGQLKDYGNELNRYIQSILQLLKIESRDFKIQRQVGDINETIEDSIRQLQPLAQQKQIEITSQLEPLFSIEGDFVLLREVILNLIENAIKYTPDHGKIHVTSFELDNRVWVEVKDDGPGIAADELQRIWRKFVRGREQDMKTKGTGLGLYLVRYFIELHGGEVSVESVPGKGTIFSFNLPLEFYQENLDGSEDLNLDRR